MTTPTPGDVAKWLRENRHWLTNNRYLPADIATGMNEAADLIEYQCARITELERQAADDPRLECETGCVSLTGGDVRHHPDCKFYPESRTKMYDDAIARIDSLSAENERLAKERDYAQAWSNNWQGLSEMQDKAIAALSSDLTSARRELETVKAERDRAIKGRDMLHTIMSVELQPEYQAVNKAARLAYERVQAELATAEGLLREIGDSTPGSGRRNAFLSRQPSSAPVADEQDGGGA
jgi:hypothetical protein